MNADVAKYMLTNEEMEIAQIQANIKKLGWQWQEQVYNDGDSADCHVEFIKNNDSAAFELYPEQTIGWGRFPRLYCWREGWKAIHKQESS